MTERIFDRPRVALPGRIKIIEAGATQRVELSPQLPMQGPWWFGMIALEELFVSSLQFDDVCVFYSPGETPSRFFDSSKPEFLIPFDANPLKPGSRVVVDIYNWSCMSVQTACVLWGNAVDSRPTAPGSVPSGDWKSLSKTSAPFDDFVKPIDPSYWK